jgi:hypothetical protein
MALDPTIGQAILGSGLGVLGAGLTILGRAIKVRPSTDCPMDRSVELRLATVETRATKLEECARLQEETNKENAAKLDKLLADTSKIIGRLDGWSEAKGSGGRARSHSDD